MPIMLEIKYDSQPDSGALQVTLLSTAEEFSGILPDVPARLAPEKQGESFVGFADGAPRIVLIAGEQRPREHKVFSIARKLAGVLNDQRKAGGARIDVSRIAEGYGTGGVEDLLLNTAYFGRTYGRYREDKQPGRFPVAIGGAKVDTGRIDAIAEALEIVRDLVQQPSGHLNPPEYAKQARAVASRIGADCKVIEEKELDAQGFGGIMTVGKGSLGHAPPRLIHISHKTDPSHPTLALVGKGITFDTGGYSLKGQEAMVMMKKDMAGSAGVFGALVALVRRKVRVNVHAILCCAENVVSAGAVRPGDVFKAYGGKTVEVLNTDAEGRLVLIDGLAYAAEHKPDILCDIATLTGACKVGLGRKIAGMFTADESLSGEFFKAGQISGDRVWPMPLPDDYIEPMQDGIADLKNIGKGRFGGAITAALFLREFVPEGTPWVHFDTYGWDDDGSQGGQPSGFGVRLFERWAVDRFGTG